MTALETAYKLEVDSLADAVEKYRNKYGDYPPDGSSWQVMERHLRKAFPQILQSELNLLNPANYAAQGWNFISGTPVSPNPWSVNTMAGIVAGVRNDFDQNVTVANGYPIADFKVMDPAEALVFFLGGFSSNPQLPFTGNGGPFAATGLAAGQTLQYNSQRSNELFDFKADRLTLTQVTAGAGATLVSISSDEEAFLGLPDARDLLPVYLNRNDLAGSAPFVYFDARTYLVQKSTLYANFYQRFSTTTAISGPGITDNEKFGAIRPLVSNTLRTPVPTRVGTPVTVAEFYAWFQTNRFMEEGKFQVIGSGTDDVYGGRLAQEFPVTPSVNDVASAFWTLPSGKSYLVNGQASANPDDVYVRLLLPLTLKNSATTIQKHKRSTGIADNAANCSERTFMTSLSVPGT